MKDKDEMDVALEALMGKGYALAAIMKGLVMEMMESGYPSQVAMLAQDIRDELIARKFDADRAEEAALQAVVAYVRAAGGH